MRNVFYGTVHSYIDDYGNVVLSFDESAAQEDLNAMIKAITGKKVTITIEEKR